MDPSSPFEDKYFDVIDSAIYPTTWQQIKYDDKLTLAHQAATVQRRAEETLEQLHQRLKTHTQALEAKVNEHSAVNKTYNKGLAALAKRENECHAGFDVERANLERQLVTVNTNR